MDKEKIKEYLKTSIDKLYASILEINLMKNVKSDVYNYVQQTQFFIESAIKELDKDQEPEYKFGEEVEFWDTELEEWEKGCYYVGKNDLGYIICVDWDYLDYCSNNISLGFNYHHVKQIRKKKPQEEYIVTTGYDPHYGFYGLTIFKIGKGDIFIYDGGDSEYFPTEQQARDKAQEELDKYLKSKEL